MYFIQNSSFSNKLYQKQASVTVERSKSRLLSDRSYTQLYFGASNNKDDQQSSTSCADANSSAQEPKQVQSLPKDKWRPYVKTAIEYLEKGWWPKPLNWIKDNKERFHHPVNSSVIKDAKTNPDRAALTLSGENTDSPGNTRPGTPTHPQHAFGDYIKWEENGKTCMGMNYLGKKE